MNHIETLQQLTQSAKPVKTLYLMIGAHNFVKDHNMISFKFKGCRAYHYCKITLNSMDLYDMQLGRISTAKQYNETGKLFSRIKYMRGLYNDMLKESFEHETGLTLSLPRIISSRL